MECAQQQRYPFNQSTLKLRLRKYIFNCFVLVFISVQEVQEEGRYAIDSPGSPNAPEIPPEDYALRKYKLSTNEMH